MQEEKKEKWHKTNGCEHVRFKTTKNHETMIEYLIHVKQTAIRSRQ